MELTLTFDRGNNVFTFMVLTPAEKRAVDAYRQTRAEDYMFLYDRQVMRALLGNAATLWSPEGFTAFEEGTALLVKVDGTEQRVDSAAVRVEFAGGGGPQDDAGDSPSDMVTVVLGCQGRRLVEHFWRDVAGPFDPSLLTLQLRTHEHGGETLVFVERVLYAGQPAERRPAPGANPEWLWEPTFFSDAVGPA